MTDKDFQTFVVEHLVKLSDGQEELRQNVAVIEHELTDKIRALFDDRSINQDYFKTIKNSLARIENELQTHSYMLIDLTEKQENQEAELRLLRTEK